MLFIARNCGSPIMPLVWSLSGQRTMSTSATARSESRVECRLWASGGKALGSRSVHASGDVVGEKISMGQLKAP